MTDPLSAASIATLIFTTAVGKLTETLTEDAQQQLGQKLQALKQLIGSKFHGKAKAALARADQGDDTDRETVTNLLGVAMDVDDDFAQQVQELAQGISTRYLREFLEVSAAYALSSIASFYILRGHPS